MANWKALTWSESIKTGKQQARHVLTTLCLKCDDDYRVFSAATRLAGFCEMSARRLYDWIDYLEEQDLITVIRRVRPNGSEAKPITLLNAPDAPHLNGVPVVLDYNGKYLYPRNPRALHAAGIRWISGTEEGGVHPSHEPVDNSAQTEPQVAKLSCWQHDSLATCVNCTEGEGPQVTQHDELSGRQHDNLSTHGVDSSSPPKHSPSEALPSEDNPLPPKPPEANAHAGEPEQPSNEGGGEASPKNNQDELARQFFRSVMSEAPPSATQPTTDEKHRLVALLKATWERGYGNAHLRSELLTSLGTVKHLGGTWIHRLERLLDQDTEKEAAKPQVPELCGQCDARRGDPLSARVEWHDAHKSSFRWCPRCHPKGREASLTSIHDAPSASPAAS